MIKLNAAHTFNWIVFRGKFGLTSYKELPLALHCMIDIFRSMIKLIWSALLLAGYCWYMIASVYGVTWSIFFDHLLALSKLGWKVTVKMNCVFLGMVHCQRLSLLSQLVEIVRVYHCQHPSSCQWTSPVIFLLTVNIM